VTLSWFAPERFEAEGLVLRCYDQGDGEELAATTVESYEHLAPWMPWARQHQSAEDAEVICRRCRASYLLHEDFVIGIFARDTGRQLGGTGFHLREGPLSGACAEIGMFIRSSEAGRGLGTRALRAMLEWGFSEAWPWHRLAWRCDERNLVSRRVAEKVGMRTEGVLRGQQAAVGDGRRNTVCYGLTRSEWRSLTALPE
jgi:RimJ/RimL family protein N-acetyltransferase